MDVKEAVRKGEAWLDENHPGWYNVIDLEKHNQQSASTCVLGQIINSRVSAHAYWDGVLQHAGLTPEQARAMGFGNTPLAELNERWRKLITKRRAADALETVTRTNKTSPSNMPGLNAVYLTPEELVNLKLVSTTVDGTPYLFTRDALGRYLDAPRTQEFFLSITTESQ